MKKLILFILLLSISMPFARALALEISVNASQTSQMPTLFEPRFFPWYFNSAESYPMQKITNDGLAKYIYTPNTTVSWNVYANQDTASFDDTINKMKQYFTDLKLNTWFTNNHINFVIGIASMPRWLSSNPARDDPIIPGGVSSGGAPIYSQSPPNCYDFECNGQKGWASLVKETVHYFNIELGLNAPLNVWHEPSWNYFYGTQQDYFQLYKYAVIGAKAADPNIKIAGPAPVHLARKEKLDLSGYESPNSMMQDFIEYADTHRLDYDNDTENVHLHYDKWPIDIISFSALDQYGNTWKNIADQTRGWLTSNGYSADTPMFAQEFGTWIYNGTDYLDPNRDKEYVASYAINQLGWMDKAAINYYYFTTLFDFHSYGSYPQSATQEFIGTNDPWTSNYVIKSVYNAFKALSIFNGKPEGELSNRIQATFNDNDFVTAVASQTKDKSKTRLLLSNFIPTFDDNSEGLQFMAGVYRTCLLSKGYTLNDANSILAALLAYNQSNRPSECSSGIWTSSCLSALISGAYGSTQTATDLLECTNNSNTGVLKKLNDLNTYKTAARQVDFTISNLPFSGTATLTTYTIDKDNANSCKINKKTEASSTNTECGVNGIIDQKVNQAKTDSINAAANYLLSVGYPQDQVNAFANCASTPSCNIQDLINNYCQQSPGQCNQLKADIAEAAKVKNGVFYYGTYTAPNGHNYSSPIYIDKINNDTELFKAYTNITVPLEGSKQESQITVINGVYQGTITMQPYSVVLMEIKRIADTQPPSTPINLSATTVSSSQINLSWTASTDNFGVMGYKIYRNGIQIATTANISYSDSGLSPSTTYTYTVSAYDTAGNTSSQSTPASAATNPSPDTTAPAKIINLAISNVTSNSITLTWTSPGDDGNTGTASSYDLRYYTSNITDFIWNNALPVTGEPTPQIAGTSQSYIVGNLQPNITYYFAIKTIDDAGNVSGLSNIPSATTIALTLNVSLNASPNSGTGSLNGVDLTATISGTQTGTANYTFYCNRSDTGTNITTPYNAKFDNVSTDTKTAIDVCNYTIPGTYTAKVIAEKAALSAENRSTITVYPQPTPSPSPSPSPTPTPSPNNYVPLYPTPTPSLTPTPTPQLSIGGPAISNISVSQISQSSAVISWTTDKNSDSQVEYGKTVSYGVLTRKTPLVTSHNVSLFGLTPNTLYHYRVKSVDSTNHYTLSQDYTFTTASASLTQTTSVSQSTSTPVSSTPISISTTTSETETNLIISETLGIDVASEQVKILQEMLANPPVGGKEIYPEGLITGYYGNLTLQAVQRFQCKYDIVCSGTPETTGYGLVGPKTRIKLNEIYAITSTSTDQQNLIDQLKEQIRQLQIMVAELLSQITKLTEEKIKQSQ